MDMIENIAICKNCIFYDCGKWSCKEDGVEPNDYCGRFEPIPEGEENEKGIQKAKAD